MPTERNYTLTPGPEQRIAHRPLRSGIEIGPTALAFATIEIPEGPALVTYHRARVWAEDGRHYADLSRCLATWEPAMKEAA